MDEYGKDESLLFSHSINYKTMNNNVLEYYKGKIQQQQQDRELYKKASIIVCPIIKKHL